MAILGPSTPSRASAAKVALFELTPASHESRAPTTQGQRRAYTFQGGHQEWPRRAPPLTSNNDGLTIEEWIWPGTLGHAMTPALEGPSSLERQCWLPMKAGRSTPSHRPSRLTSHHMADRARLRRCERRCRHKSALSGASNSIARRPLGERTCCCGRRISKRQASSIRRVPIPLGCSSLPSAEQHASKTAGNALAVSPSRA